MGENELKEIPKNYTWKSISLQLIHIFRCLIGSTNL